MYTEIIKIGNVELTREEAERLFNDRRFIVTYSKIYCLVYKAGHIRGKEVYTSKGMTRKGRFYALTGEQINDLVGFKLA